MAMKTDKEEMNIGILDIYGFEIFEVRLTCYMICFRLLFYWQFSFTDRLRLTRVVYLFVSCRRTALNSFVLIL